jgi:hypothetical protein
MLLQQTEILPDVHVCARCSYLRSDILSVRSQISQAKQPARSRYTNCNTTMWFFPSVHALCQAWWCGVVCARLKYSELSVQFEGFFLNKFVMCDLGLAFHLHAVFLFWQVTCKTKSFCYFFAQILAIWTLGGRRDR